MSIRGVVLYGGRRTDDIWTFPKVAGNALIHQNQKPVELIKLCIEKSSDPGAVVFDGFSGSATTAIACMMSARHYIGCEIDPDYFKRGNLRIIDYYLNEE